MIDDRGLPEIWSLRLGCKASPPTVGMVNLYKSVVDNGAWPLNVNAHLPGLALHVSSVEGGYLISGNDGQFRDWRLLVEDPLTLLQIAREGWDRDPDTLILNLIKKGLPFRVLNACILQGAEFYNHPGPTIHPPGRSPNYIDYLAYRQELKDFFMCYPHTYTAALSAGGILWRIAMDVLPLPAERDITRAFHPDACLSRFIGEQEYWTPQLSESEEHVIVGVYRWAESK